MVDGRHCYVCDNKNAVKQSSAVCVVKLSLYACWVLGWRRGVVVSGVRR